MKDLKFVGRSSADGWLRDLLILLFLFSFPFFQYLGGLPLIDPDEGRYAEIPREMLESLDFITPTLNYVKYFEKPPLLYWINAASLKLFGMNEFGARFPSALCGLLTVIATYIIARRLYGRRTALLASVILGTSIGFVLQSRIILTDMLLTFTLTGALGAFIIAAQREGKRSQELPYFSLYFFSALATLAKGLIGIVFPAGIIFWYLLISKRWRLLKEMRILPGVLLFFALTAPWFVMVSLRNPEFARFFFIHEHFERFTSSVHGRYQPIWFFVPVLFATMLPWSCYIPSAVARAWKNRHFEEGKGGMFLVIWIVVIFLFFSKSNSKLIPYILPIFPPLAILIANRFDAFIDSGRELKFASILTSLILIALGAAFVGYAYLPEIVSHCIKIMPSQSDALQRFVANAPLLGVFASMTIGIVFLIQGVASFTFSGRNAGLQFLMLFIGSFLLMLLLPRLMLGTIAATETSRALALKAGEVASANSRMVTFGPLQGVSWYLKQRVLVTGELDELTFGSSQGEQKEWFPDQGEFLKLWGGKEHLLVFLKKRELDQILSKLAPEPIVLGTSGRLFLISNR